VLQRNEWVCWKHREERKVNGDYKGYN
jgi:hypothetical protein